MQLALIGCGRWGRNHARILADAGWLGAVVDPDVRQRDFCRQLDPRIPTFGDLAELNWPSVDGVVIASPIECHVGQALTALEHEKHCFVEKPMARDRRDVDRLTAAAERAGRVLATGHVLDYHPATRALVQLCRTDQLGRLKYWHSARARLVPPRRFVSVVEELMWHDLSVLLRVTGRTPDAVRSVGRLEQDGTLILEFGEFYATLRASQVQPLRESSIVVAGDRGTVRFDDELQPADKLTMQDIGGSAQRVRLAEIEPLAAEIEHFVAAARGNIAPFSGVEQVQEILAVIERAGISCAI